MEACDTFPVFQVLAVHLELPCHILHHLQQHWYSKWLCSSWRWHGVKTPDPPQLIWKGEHKYVTTIASSDCCLRCGPHHSLPVGLPTAAVAQVAHQTKRHLGELDSYGEHLQWSGWVLGPPAGCIGGVDDGGALWLSADMPASAATRWLTADVGWRHSQVVRRPASKRVETGIPKLLGRCHRSAPFPAQCER